MQEKKKTKPLIPGRNRLKLQISLGQYVCFAICLLLMLIIPISRDHKIIGINLSISEGKEKVETVTATPDGTTVINTTDIGSKFIGYSGPTPVAITIQDDKIVKVKALENQETPEFFGAVRNSSLLESYDGLTLQEASEKKLDAVSGATYTSTAIINNMKAGVDYALDNEATIHAADHPSFDLKWFFTLAVILCGAILPLILKNKKYRYLQLALNVGILGFWGGTFVSYSNMVGYLTNGLTSAVLIPVVLMLVTAFIYPMFGKVDHYCNWLCPYGSIQELAGKCVSKKLTVGPKTAKVLTVSREVLWFGLMWLLWTGLWFDWMGYEPFAAFFFRDASPVVLSIAGAFLLLSFFVNRPYCRFVCPTGSLFKFSEGRR